ncbi:MAG: triose-phosphate isomerase [Deltaproteobacteria bacterium]|nr:triose-phosphate isomerase [Deltaproteobacteria bacterium]
MRKPVIAGNWKMYKTDDEAVSFARDFLPKAAGVDAVEIVLAPSYPSLAALISAVAGSGIKIAAQNMHFAEEGAFTGEVSADMLLAIGVSHVIIGHSERRQYFREDDEIVNMKTKAAIAKGIVPIVCVGETLEEREKGETNNVVRIQVERGLKNTAINEPSSLIIAYEPVWAIGTGKTATPEQAQEVHAFVRGLLSETFGEDTARGMRILYGGSVKPDNIKALMAKSDIDGGLVGGASLDPASFEKLVKFYM